MKYCENPSHLFQRTWSITCQTAVKAEKSDLKDEYRMFFLRVCNIKSISAIYVLLFTIFILGGSNMHILSVASKSCRNNCSTIAGGFHNCVQGKEAKRTNTHTEI